MDSDPDKDDGDSDKDKDEGSDDSDAMYHEGQKVPKNNDADYKEVYQGVYAYDPVFEFPNQNEENKVEVNIPQDLKDMNYNILGMCVLCNNKNQVLVYHGRKVHIIDIHPRKNMRYISSIDMPQN